MVVVKNLTKTIKIKKEEKNILKNINLNCPDKGMVLIYGNSGCGKTTLLNILEGLDKKYSGTVEILKKNIKSIPDYKYLKNISIIFQDCNFINGYTVLENIEIILRSKKIKFDPLLIETKLNQFKIKNLLYKRIEELSGGEKQILLLVLTQFETSKIVFCDEPTGSIDEENELIALKILKELAREKLVIVVSHNVALFLKHCDKAYYMEEGELYD